MDQLNAMVGLASVKKQFARILALNEYRQALRQSGVDVDDTSTNLVLEGNPGTGKTEVAALISRALYEAGVLPGSGGREVFVSVSPAQIKGAVLGKTEENMRKAFDAAKGGVLFIDEAHNWGEQGDAYNKSAMQTLLKLTEDNRDKVMVILGGYKNLQQDLADIDIGLPRRFPVKIDFPDYEPKEKYEIGANRLKQQGYTMTPKAKKLYQQAVSNITGQAGDVRNFNDVLLEEIAVRYGSAKAKGKVSAKFKMQQLNEADVRAAIAHYRDDMNEPINIEQ